MEKPQVRQFLWVWSFPWSQAEAAPKPPEMNLHTQQHLSLSDQTWPSMSVTHCSLCPSVKEEESTLRGASVQEAGSPWRLGDPLSPWQPAPLCLHSIYSSPVPAPASCESANMLPFYCLWRATRWEGCVLNQCWLMKCIWHPKASCAPFHSWISSQWMKWMKCKGCFMSFFYVVTSGCTGVLGAAGMGDVCTWLSHAEAPHLGSTWWGEESLFTDTTDLGHEEE